MAVLTWTAVYPAITILLVLSEEILSKIDSLPLRTLVLNLFLSRLWYFCSCRFYKDDFQNGCRLRQANTDFHERLYKGAFSLCV